MRDEIIFRSRLMPSFYHLSTGQRVIFDDESNTIQPYQQVEGYTHLIKNFDVFLSVNTPSERRFYIYIKPGLVEISGRYDPNYSPPHSLVGVALQCNLENIKDIRFHTPDFAHVRTTWTVPNNYIQLVLHENETTRPHEITLRTNLEKELLSNETHHKVFQSKNANIILRAYKCDPGVYIVFVCESIVNVLNACAALSQLKNSPLPKVIIEYFFNEKLDLWTGTYNKTILPDDHTYRVNNDIPEDSSDLNEEIDFSRMTVHMLNVYLRGLDVTQRQEEDLLNMDEKITFIHDSKVSNEPTHFVPFYIKEREPHVTPEKKHLHTSRKRKDPPHLPPDMSSSSSTH
jgi:hypothetical protein